MNHTRGSRSGSGARPGISTGDGSPPAERGVKFVSATLVTPGSARAASSTCVYSAASLTGSWARSGGGEMKNVTSPCGSNPGFTARSRHRLLINNPAPTTRTTARAISLITSAARRRCRPCPVPAPALPSFKESVRSARAARRAGKSPVAMVVMIVTPSANASTQPSTCTVSSRGSTDGAARLSNAMAAYAPATPSPPPRDASTTLSVSSCLTTRPRPAPKADRMASSRPRAPARASVRLATLTQPIIRTRPTATTSTSSCCVVPNRISSRSGNSATDVQSALNPGYVAASRRATPSRSAFACSRVIPGLRRPMMRQSAWKPRWVRARSVAATVAIGMYSCSLAQGGEAGGYGGRNDALEALGAGEPLTAAAHVREVGERRALGSPVEERRVGRRPECSLAALLSQHEQPILLGKGQRPEQHTVHDAEHGGVGADGECQGQDPSGREAGTLAERPDRVAEVLEHCIHLGLRCSGVRGRVPGVRGTPRHLTPGTRHLFVPQRHHRIDLRRPPCGEVARQRRDDREQGYDPHESHGIARANSVQEGREQPSNRQRDHDAEPDPRRREP